MLLALRFEFKVVDLEVLLMSYAGLLAFVMFLSLMLMG